MSDPVDALIDEFWQRLMQLVAPARTLAEVRPTCVVAIRRLEGHLAAALSDRSLRLRNLPNIGSDEVPIHALRVRGKVAHRLEPFDPTWPKGKDVSALVLRDDGRLWMVTVVGGRSVGWRMADEQDLVAEDVQGFVRALRYWSERNRRADHLADIAENLLRLLDEAHANTKLGGTSE